MFRVLFLLLCLSLSLADHLSQKWEERKSSFTTMAIGSAKIEDSKTKFKKIHCTLDCFFRHTLKITAHFNAVQSLSSAFFRLFFFLANVNVVDSSSELFSEESANIPLYEFLDCGLLLRPEFEFELPVFLFILELLELLPPAPRCLLLRLLLRGLSSSFSLSDSELYGESLSPALTRLFLDFLEEASLPEAFLRFELNCVAVVVVSSSLSLSSRSESVSAKAKRSMNFFFCSSEQSCLAARRAFCKLGWLKNSYWRPEPELACRSMSKWVRVTSALRDKLDWVE